MSVSLSISLLQGARRVVGRPVAARQVGGEWGRDSGGGSGRGARGRWPSHPGVAMIALGDNAASRGEG
jgi:hypothetical protein